MLGGNQRHGILVIRAIAGVVVYKNIRAPGCKNLVKSLGISGVAFQKIAVEVVVAGIAPETVGGGAVLVHAAGVATVQRAVDVALDDVAGWGTMLANALNETGGPMTAEERAWADTALGVPKARRRSAA